MNDNTESANTTTPWEDSQIAGFDGIAAHESATVYIDDEDGTWWALCWVKMPKEQA